MFATLKSDPWLRNSNSTTPGRSASHDGGHRQEAQAERRCRIGKEEEEGFGRLDSLFELSENQGLFGR